VLRQHLLGHASVADGALHPRVSTALVAAAESPLEEALSVEEDGAEERPKRKSTGSR
jgi:hypothetical protein